MGKKAKKETGGRYLRKNNKMGNYRACWITVGGLPIAEVLVTEK